MMVSEKNWNRWKNFILLATVLATVKLVFVDYTMDEEYQIVMAYRRVLGDSLFGTMWEPHQTSAFLCTILVRIFMKITRGTEFLVIYLRACTTAIQVGLSFWMYRVLRRLTEEKYSFLLSICYFNMVPKLIQIPEFANMQLWFFTISVLSFLMYYNGEQRKRWLVAAGIGMALEVLSYPSCLILFPFFCVIIWLRSEKRNRIRDCIIFAGTCAVMAVVWIVRVLSQVTMQEFFTNLKNAILYDATHNLNPAEQSKGMFLASECLENLILLAVIFLLSAVICYLIKHKNLAAFSTIAVVVAEAIQMFYWVILRTGYERPQIIALVLLICALLNIKKFDCGAGHVAIPIVGTLVVIAGVLYMSDLGLWNALAHSVLGVVFGSLVILRALEREEKEKAPKWIFFLLISLVLVGCFGKATILKTGKTETNTILGVRNVVKNGPAKGIFTNYMKGYVINCCYEDFMKNVEPGAKCLIVTNMVDEAGTTPYMMNDYEICHFSIVDPTTYDEKLLTYWEAYPEKYPDVIVVDCWYGQLMEEEDSWIMRYIEEEFGYSEVVEGRYVRFYKR